MKTSKDHYIKFDEKQIVITKAFAQAANVIGSSAYNEIKKLRKDYPDFDITLKTSEIRNRKKTHKDLTLERMREIVVKREGTNSLKLKVFDEARAEKVSYPKIKEWFLREENFKDYDKDEMPEEKAS